MSDRSAFLWFLGLSAGLTSIALVVYGLASPATRRNLSREHGVIEVPTAVFFLAAAVIGIYCLRQVRAGRGDLRWTIPALAFLALLDEVNWIIFSLGVRRPFVLGHRVDSLHDFLEIAVIWMQHRAPLASALVVGVATAGLLSWSVYTAPRWWPRLKRSVPWRFVGIALLLAVLAQAIDLFASQRNRFARLCEEVLELDAALALLFAACFSRRR